ncbi:MAG: AAA family ATPase, partial [Shimia sp.]
MSQTSDQMELREEAITARYDAALALLDGFDHAPRIGKAKESAEELSPGIGTRRRFRSTTPGLAGRRVQRAAGVHLRAAIADDLTTPLQATVLHALRRSLAIAIATGDAFADLTELGTLKRENLAGALSSAQKAQFGELLAAEALAQLFTFASALAFLLAPHTGEASVEIGEVEEVLTDNAPLALQGALWELDQDIAAFAADDAKLVATCAAFAEALMAKVSARAANAP